MVLMIENDEIFLFDPQMGPEQVPPLWVRVDPGVMAMKGHSTFPKAPELKSHRQMGFIIMSRILIEDRSYRSAEMQLAYSIQPQPTGIYKERGERLYECGCMYVCMYSICRVTFTYSQSFFKCFVFESQESVNKLFLNSNQ